jgi:Rrf2 family protein
MKLELTRRGSYAIRAALALSRRDAGAVVPAARIAQEMAIPRRFLPQVMSDLVRAGLVHGVVGRAGGYRLARDPSEVSLLSIIEAAEGEPRRRTCVLKGSACGSAASPCDVHGVFEAAQEALLRELAGATLATLTAGPSGPGRGAGPRAPRVSEPGRAAPA